MTCGCKHKKKGSGGTYLSGVTWGGYSKAKTGRGMRMSGTGAFRKRRKKKRGSGVGGCGQGMFSYQGKCHPSSGGAAFRKRRKTKRGRGMGMSGSGINFSGSGMVNDAMRVVLNRFRNGRRVI